jgi:starch-binding outer membrane protein, SusD/RagB family
MKKIFKLLFAASLILGGCEKEYLERVPTTSITDKDLFSTVVGAQTALEGIHRSTYLYGGAHDKFGQKAIDLAIDLLGEDMYQTVRGYGWFVSWYQYIDHRNINASNTEYVWEYYYDIIDNANNILVNIDAASDAALYPEQVNNIKAQALAYRAHSTYQLVQLYADRYVQGGANDHLGVPIMTEPTQEGKARSTVAQVYAQINADLDAAIAAFTEAPSIGRPNTSHLNLRVAQGIKARVALTTGDWPTASAMANAARTGYTPVAPEKYEYGWNKASGNSEWMWGSFLIDEQQTSYASFFSHIDPYFGGYAQLGNHKLLSTAVFDFMSATDVRKATFKTIAGKPRVGKKFTGNGGFINTGRSNWTNDYLFMAAGEMYLIEAEALARQGQDGPAATVLFGLISKRDPLYVQSILTGEELIQHILMHRRADMWGLGQRFLDLKRLNLPLDRYNLGHTESLWNAAGSFPAGDKNFTFLIPKQEIDANPLMVQNEL